MGKGSTLATLVLGGVLAAGNAAPIAGDELVVRRNGERATGALQSCVGERCQWRASPLPRAEIAWIAFAASGSTAEPPSPTDPTRDTIWLSDGRTITSPILGISLSEVALEEESFDRSAVAWVYFGSPEGAPRVAEAAPPRKSAAPPVASAVPPAAPPAATPPHAVARAAEPPRDAEPAAPPLYLNEVGVLASERRAAFVEIGNRGDRPLPLDGVALRNERKEECRLPRGASVPAGALYLVTLDGASGGAAPNCRGSLLIAGGRLELLAAGARQDALDWGESPSGLALRTRGGRIAPVRPGSSFGRPPQSAGRGGAAWVTYSGDQVTPGAPNPLPRVNDFAALPGAIFARREVPLTWYAVGGTARYRVQVATQEDFAAPLLDRVVEAPAGGAHAVIRLTSPPLADGRYVWRVQALGAAEAPFSAPRAFEVRTAGGAAGGARRSVPHGKSGAAAPPPAAAPAGTVVTLPVPWIEQRKDTSLLALEADEESGPRRWDGVWQVQPPYCARASIAMVTSYYGGKLSQDRITYEAYHDRMPEPGPEIDIYVDAGFTDAMIRRALKYALGAEPSRRFLVPVDYWQENQAAFYTGFPETADMFIWQHVADSIDQGRPVLGTSECHAWVYAGYRRTGEALELLILDPAMGTYYFKPGAYRELTGDIDSVPAGEAVTETYFLPKRENAHPESDEESISTDGDGDGVMDYDEELRFFTKTDEKDSDDDGVDDKQEIRASVFEPPHGWSIRTRTVQAGQLFPRPRDTGRDLDGDGKAMERDPDSDDGGCDDGEEDINGNGRRDPGETSNFDKADDPTVAPGECGELWTGSSVTTYSTHQPEGFTEITVSADLRLRETRRSPIVDPGPAHGGKNAGDRIGSISNFTCAGTALHVTWSQRYWSSAWTCNCTGDGQTTMGEAPELVDGFILRKNVDWSLTPILGYDVPRATPLYAVACSARPDETFTVTCNCTDSGSTSGTTQYPYPAGAGLGDPLTTTRCNHDPEVRYLSTDGNQMVGSYRIVETTCSPDTAVSTWSLSKAGTPLAPMPPLPEE